ncbi:MAG: hypothetical protein ACXQTE_06055 [Methanosarcinaceae archaeon]
MMYLGPAEGLHYTGVKAEFKAMIASGDMTVRQAEFEHWHEVWTRVVSDIPHMEYTTTEET